MTKQEKENQINALKNLGLTEKEIAEVLADDERIDKGEKLFELSTELEKGAKKARLAGNTAGYTKAKREKEPNTEKREIINSLINAVEGDRVEVTNPEREFIFFKGDTKYKVVLSCPRK